MDEQRAFADLDCRVALVTGCGSPDGIGFATARLLGRQGAKVAITSTTERIQERVAELGEEGITASGHVADLSDPDEAARVVAETVEQGKNAAEAVVVDYDVLPALVSVADAAKKQSGVTIHDIAPDNQCYKWALGDKAQVQ